MEDASAAPELPPSLRFLKWLVIALMLTMIGGVIAIVALLVTRLPSPAPAPMPAPALPASVDLPEGEVAEAVTLAKGMVIVVSESGRIFVFAPDGALRGEVAVD